MTTDQSGPRSFVPAIVLLAVVGLALTGLFPDRAPPPCLASPGDLPGRPDSASPAPPAPANNQYCLDCHLNYGFDPFAEGHRIAGFGCVRCHGASIPHSEDESGKVPPDRMYPSAEINDSCLPCHKNEELPADCKLSEELKVCMDCHNTHRLDDRKRRWDKATGELIFCAEEDDGGMGEEM